VGNGKITSSGSALYLHNGASTLVVNSQITGTLDLVMDSMSQTGTTPTIQLNNGNNYVGTAYVNGVIVRLNNTTGGGTRPSPATS